MSIQTIAVLSDIHGNADALVAAIAQVKTINPELVVVLGDLLTYGVQPREVLDAVDQLKSEQNCIFICGNHDQFYFDLDRGNSAFYDNISDFVLESVHWTHAKVADLPPLWERYPWCTRYEFGPILFSHANPYEYSDWSYVSKPEQWVPAAQNLRDNGFSIGVFGHSHRSFAVIVDADGRAEKVETDVWLKPAAGEVLLLNPGTVGQPRGTGFTYLTIQLDGSQVKVSLPNIDFDRAKFCREIAATDLSKATKDKLVSFMEK